MGLPSDDVGGVCWEGVRGGEEELWDVEGNFRRLIVVNALDLRQGR